MYLATLSRTSAILTPVISLYSSGTLQNLHGAPPHPPFQNSQYPHPTPQRHIARPCPSHLPNTRTRPQPQPRRIAPPCPPIIPTEAAQNKTSPSRLASTNPPAHPAAPCVNIYLRSISIAARRHSSCASPHEENTRDGVLGAFLIPLPFHTYPLFTHEHRPFIALVLGVHEHTSLAVFYE
jgi:hypothetical protein